MMERQDQTITPDQFGCYHGCPAGQAAATGPRYPSMTAWTTRVVHTQACLAARDAKGELS